MDHKDKPSEIVVGEPKNRKHRLIPITDDIRDLLRRIEAVGLSVNSEFVFVDENGNRCTERAICCAIARRGKAAGVAPASIHRIRRTVSAFLNQVLPQKEVSEMLGHSEKVNEMYYNGSIASTHEKAEALNHISTKILGFKGSRPA